MENLPRVLPWKWRANYEASQPTGENWKGSAVGSMSFEKVALVQARMLRWSNTWGCTTMLESQKHKGTIKAKLGGWMTMLWRGISLHATGLDLRPQIPGKTIEESTRAETLIEESTGAETSIKESRTTEQKVDWQNTLLSLTKGCTFERSTHKWH